ncbi:hypothetical protein OV090_04515 [Nannocystis sp. RBIL2]|nr:hypothetical protein [Nannocystis sp. RBIL2]MCY1064012.1 hypothetical protein [Nannocystis sp. RBIL2]
MFFVACRFGHAEAVRRVRSGSEAVTLRGAEAQIADHPLDC